MVVASSTKRGAAHVSDLSRRATTRSSCTRRAASPRYSFGRPYRRTLRASRCVGSPAAVDRIGDGPVTEVDLALWEPTMARMCEHDRLLPFRDPPDGALGRRGDRNHDLPLRAAGITRCTSTPREGRIICSTRARRSVRPTRSWECHRPRVGAPRTVRARMSPHRHAGINSRCAMGSHPPIRDRRPKSGPHGCAASDYRG